MPNLIFFFNKILKIIQCFRSTINVCSHSYIRGGEYIFYAPETPNTFTLILLVKDMCNAQKYVIICNVV